VQLTLTAVGIAGTTGMVAPDPVGASCGTGCFSYTAGQRVTIMAVAQTPALFVAWSDDCVDQGATCTLTLSGDKAITGHFRPNLNIMFVSDGEMVPAEIGRDLARADAFCARSAARAFVGGSNWKAWLATTTTDAAAHVGRSTPGWIRVDGRPFAVSMNDLLAGKVLFPPRITEFNQSRSVRYSSVTGADGTGAAISNGTCGDWTSSGTAYVGEVTDTTNHWTYDSMVPGNSCGNSSYSVYCFENDDGMAAVTAPLVPPNGRHAFVSRTMWLPGGGIEAADAVCQSDAAAAGLANSTDYLSLLDATVSATDPTRVRLTGQPWYRLDGAQLVATATDLAAPAADKMLTALNVSSIGEYLADLSVWSGGHLVSSRASVFPNCTNWTSSAATDGAVAGLVYVSTSQWWTGSGQTCNVPLNLYCFER
jgi:hypothetical protein